MVLRSILVASATFATSAMAASFVCSTQNTGSDTSATFSMYQSMGACSQTCSGRAFAIVQGSNCWCSDLAPGSTTSSSSCNTECPGFPTDNCGGTQNGAYAYYQLAQASGTATDASSTPTTAASNNGNGSSSGNSGNGNGNGNGGLTTTTATQAATPTTSAQQQRVTVIVTQSASGRPASTVTAPATNGNPSVVYVTVPATNTTPTTTSSGRTTLATTTSSNGAGTRSSSGAGTSATTLGSNVNSSLASNNADSSFFSSPGKVAGTFVAVGLVLLAIIGGLLWFFCVRRRKSDEEKGGYGRNDSPTSTVDGTASLAGHSRSGSNARLFGAVGNEKLQRGGTTSTKAGRGAPSPIQWPNGETTDVVPVDQRMDPRPMLMRFDSNYSRHSLRDEEDYSRRVLTVTNPT